MIRCVVNSLFDAMQKKLNSEVEIGGVDDIVNVIDQAKRDSQPVLGEVNSLTDTILTILTTNPHQPQYDFWQPQSSILFSYCFIYLCIVRRFPNQTND
jgi:hypothetical protein